MPRRNHWQNASQRGAANCTAVRCRLLFTGADFGFRCRNLLYVISVTALTVNCQKRTDDEPLFSRGVYPVVFAYQDFPLHPETGKPMTSSKDCAPCHTLVYRNWQKTRHRLALTNELYKESHAREPSPWCVNCHAPLRMIGSEKIPYRGEEGISCLVCHVRGGKVLTGAIPMPKNGKIVHDYRIDPQFKDERLCENCHEFNFPTAASALSEGKDFHYTTQPMQATVSEYRQSSYYGKVSCQGCHLFRDSEHSHTFPGGHAIDRLRNDLKIEALRQSENSLTLRILAHGIGHAFPTGDLFRTLRIILHDPTLREMQQVELRHFFQDSTPANADTTQPAKIRVAEEVLPPPKTDYISMREYALPWPNYSQRVIAELYIDYLSGLNTRTTHLPQNTTRPLIKRQVFKLKPIAKSDAQG
ncbi:MAG: cytochrome c family protein [Turneriella sp.]|nr:cytochrome c family protein [Turneriella sp.]